MKPTGALRAPKRSGSVNRLPAQDVVLFYLPSVLSPRRQGGGNKNGYIYIPRSRQAKELLTVRWGVRECLGRSSKTLLGSCALVSLYSVLG